MEMDIDPFKEEDLIEHQGAILEMANEFKDGGGMSEEMQQQVQDHLVRAVGKNPQKKGIVI